MISVVFTQGAFDSYDIPEYEYRSFQLNGSDLFNSTSQGDNSTTTMNMGANYISKYQSPGYNLEYGLDYAYQSLSTSDGTNDFDESTFTMDVPFSVEKYFDDTKGMFGFADGMYESEGGNNIDNTTGLPLTVVAGYGRIVSTKPVAQAYAIADALGIDADDDIIAAIAAVIGSAASYESIYKDNATQQYYNDLAEASGVNGSAMQIQKVLTSPAYNISDRFTGWDVRAGLYNDYMQDTPSGVDPDAGYMYIEANYAMPIEMDSQVLVNFFYTSDLNDDDVGSGIMNGVSAGIEGFSNDASDDDDHDHGDHDHGDDDDYYDDDYYDDDYYDDDYYDDYGGYYYYDDDYRSGGSMTAGGWSTMNLTASYTKDHSYNWSSTATFGYVSESFEVLGADGSFENSGMSLTLSTTRAILNQLSVTASYSYKSVDGDGYENIDPISTISTNVTYWIF